MRKIIIFLVLMTFTNHAWAQSNWVYYPEETNDMGDVYPASIEQQGKYLLVRYGCRSVSFWLYGTIDIRSRKSIRLRFDDEKTYPIRVFHMETPDSDGLMTLEARSLGHKMKIHNRMRVEIYAWRNNRHVFDVPLSGFTAEYAKLGC